MLSAYYVQVRIVSAAYLFVDFSNSILKMEIESSEKLPKFSAELCVRNFQVDDQKKKEKIFQCERKIYDCYKNFDQLLRLYV